MSMEIRVVSPDRDVKVTSRTYVWKDETRAAAPDYDATRVVQIYGTDESVDRHNTIFRVDGWDFDNYRKNPVFLWAHNEDMAVPTMPIGRTIGIQREEFTRADGKANKRLLFDIEFPKRGTYPWADLVHDMYKQDFLRASSVGFRNVSNRPLNPKDNKEEMERDGYNMKMGYAAELTKNQLIELSACAVGSNPNALAKAMRDLVPAEHRALLDVTDPNVQITEEWLKARFAALEEALAPADSKTDETSEEDPIDDAEIAPDADAFNREIEAAAEELEKESHNEPDPLEDFKNEMRAQFKNLQDEVKTLREELKQVRIAADGDPASPASDEPDPSHLDTLLAENLDTLQRMSSLFDSHR